MFSQAIKHVLTMSSAGSSFAAQHAEAIFVSANSTSALRPKIDTIRKLAAEQGRDPSSIKFFASLTPIVGKTDEEAQEKLRELKKYASTVGGLVEVSGWTGIDMSKIPLDDEIIPEHSTEAARISSVLSILTNPGEGNGKWTPRVIAEKAAIGGLAPVAVGSPSTVADEMERWIREADIDGFNISYVETPGTFEDLVELLIPELRRRGVYPDKVKDGLTQREKVYGEGQSGLRSDHIGSSYKYDVYEEEKPYVAEVKPSQDAVVEAEDESTKIPPAPEKLTATSAVTAVAV